MNDSKNIIPEVVVFESIKSLLSLIKSDLADNAAEEKNSMLYLLLQENKLQNYIFFEQAKTVFALDNLNEPRSIEVNMGWDVERITKKIPTIHIMLGNDSPKDDTLGVGSGNNSPNFSNTQDTYRKTHQRSFLQICSLMITSDNSNEIILIYHVLKGFLISVIDHLNFLGLRNVQISGDDMQLSSELADKLLIRRLNLRYDYSFNSPAIFTDTFIKNIFFKIKPKVNEKN